MSQTTEAIRFCQFVKMSHPAPCQFDLSPQGNTLDNGRQSRVGGGRRIGDQAGQLPQRFGLAGALK